MNKIYVMWMCLMATATVAMGSSPFESTKDLPVAYQGRFRSLEATAQLWLYDSYHRPLIKPSDLASFQTAEKRPIELLWKRHFLGRQTWDQAPLFWIHYAAVKALLGLDVTKDRFSFQQLVHALYENPKTNHQVIQRLLTDEFVRHYHQPNNRARSTRIELATLAPGLWVELRDDQALIVSQTPQTPPWHFIQANFLLNPHVDLSKRSLRQSPQSEEIIRLLQSLNSYAEKEGHESASEIGYQQDFIELTAESASPGIIAQALANRHPLYTRFQGIGSTLKMLPLRDFPGEWASLHALKMDIYDEASAQLKPIYNFTLFSDQDFQNIRTAYLHLEHATKTSYPSSTQVTREALKLAATQFAEAFTQAYSSLEGQVYRQALKKALYYPSLGRLKAETLYYQLPLISAAIAIYGCALVLFLLATLTRTPKLNLWANLCVAIGFIIHTGLLILRCYILQRPPVSNMFETVIYVPWIALVLGMIFYFFSRHTYTLAAACFASLALLILLHLANVDSRLENVQAVLDSQYWLIVHVLMVVGSYGAFILCGVLAHFFLIERVIYPGETSADQFLARYILYAMYIGLALLIPGTLLGGVWAAESWGRFWDWDPKEAWAFISACIYLLVLHAYTFHYIQNFGLAIGAIGGLMTISFTWYGVNYILGTGLHSYGFGKGGEEYYFLFLFSELAFLVCVASRRRRV